MIKVSITLEQLPGDEHPVDVRASWTPEGETTGYERHYLKALCEALPTLFALLAKETGGSVRDLTKPTPPPASRPGPSNN